MDADQFGKIDFFDSLRTPDSNQLGAQTGAILKRVFDIVTSFFGLIILSPLFLYVAIRIKQNDSGPIFYRGPRVGKGGRIFQILKFRTMYETEQSYQGPRITASGDNRITPLGHWLRNTKLNELPQIWNVFIGDMSIVGPRPEDPEYAAKWPEEASHAILTMRPGITSPASISYHDEEKLLSEEGLLDAYVSKIMPDKLRMDCLYVRHHSFLGDLDVIFLTLLVLIPRLSQKPMAEGWLFGGPLSRLVRTYVNWFLIDFVIAFLAVGSVGLIWRLAEPLDMGFQASVVAAALMAMFFGLTNSLLGLKRVVWSRAAPEDIFGLFISCGIVATLSMVSEFFLPWPNFPIGFLVIVSLIVLFCFVVVRYRFRLITGLASRWASWRGTGYGTGERVLIVGAGAGGEFATWLLRRPDFQRLFSIVGYIDDDPKKQDMRIDGLRVMGTTHDIPDLVSQHDIGVIFYAIGKSTNADEERIVSICKNTRAHFISVVDVLGNVRDQLLNAYSDGSRKDPAAN